MRVLPVFKILDHTIRSVFTNFAVAFLTSIPVILVSCAAYLLFTTTGGGSRGGIIFLMIPGYVAFAGAISTWAVNWHRFILSGERPTPLGYLWSKGPVGRYFGNALLIALILKIAEYLLRFGLEMISLATQSSLLTIVCAAALIFTLVWWSLRLSIKLPAVALGGYYSLSDAWEATRGNFWRFAGLTSLILIFYVGLFWAAYSIGASNFSLILKGYVSWKFVLVVGVFLWAETILGISLLTTLYGFFGEGRDIVDGKLVKPEPKPRTPSWTPSHPDREPVVTGDEVGFEAPAKPLRKTPVKKPAKKKPPARKK